MRNIKLVLEYDGRDYFGWQIQRHQVTTSPGHQSTIQETVEKALQEILQEKIKLIVSGRTDAGVHAVAQVANFKTSSKIPLARLQLALNSVLPHDIAVAKIEDAAADFHARFAAKSKTYRYVILNQACHSPLLRDKVYFCRYPLDIKLMRKEAKALLGRRDFKAFAASATCVKDTRRSIKNIKIAETSLSFPVKRSLITIDIEADGFLYNMVRNIVGTLIEVGRGRLAPQSVKKILLSKDRRLAGPAAPAKGLFLVKVNY